jgi:hypothetical protein
MSGGIAAVPEPATGLAVVAVGGLAYAIRMRRRR